MSEERRIEICIEMSKSTYDELQDEGYIVSDMQYIKERQKLCGNIENMVDLSTMLEDGMTKLSTVHSRISDKINEYL